MTLRFAEGGVFGVIKNETTACSNGLRIIQAMARLTVVDQLFPIRCAIRALRL
jgi:hypothetical protein